MSFQNENLLLWLRRRGARVEKATLGQLIILIELASSPSVAAVSRSSGGGEVSASVNYRQKLNRLEQALGVGRLTYRDGSVTRPTEIGRRVAREAELFLCELQGISVPSAAPTWMVGAGESWLQTVIVPAVVTLAAALQDSRWEVRNLRAHDIGDQLRAGKLHFGFMRLADAKSIQGIERTGAAIPLPGYKILAHNADAGPRDAAGLVRWLIRSRRPLVQQGTTWTPLSRELDEQLGLSGSLMGLEPCVFCETHVQAVSAATEGNAWCIAPAMLGGSPAHGVRVVPIKTSARSDEAGLFVYPRALGRFAAAETARSALRKELGQRLAHFHR